MKDRTGKAAVFIDGPNLYAATKALQFDFDFKKLKSYFEEEYPFLLQLNYYTSIYEDVDGKKNLQKLVDFLDFNGYNVVSKAAKEFIDYQGNRKIKGNMNVELALDASDIAQHVEEVVLMSGDGDYCALVTNLRRKGVRVTVISTLQNKMVSDDLRRAADIFIDLEDVKKYVCQDAVARVPVRA